MHRDAVSTSPVNDVKNEPNTFKEDKGEKVEGEKLEPSKAEPAVASSDLNKKEETNIDSQKAYLASMKRNAVVEADTVAATGTEASSHPIFKESPRKKSKVSHTAK